MKAIKIHEIDTGEIKLIQSGDNKSWRTLSRLDRSMIKEVVRLQSVITCGKTIYEPIY